MAHDMAWLLRRGGQCYMYTALCRLGPLASKAAAVGKGAGGRQIYKPNYFFRNASTTNSSETPVSVFCTALSSGDRFACARPRGGRAIRKRKW